MRIAKMTNKEIEVLKYIIQFKQVNGYAPTVREIATGTYTTSVSYIYEVLENLKHLGYITYKNNKYRTINVLKFI